MVEIKGGIGHEFRVTFGTPITDPYILIGSLCSIMTFRAGTTVTKLTGGATFDASGNVARVGAVDAASAQSDLPVGLTDANGTIRLEDQSARSSSL